MQYYTVTRGDVQEYIMARLGWPVLDLELELQEKGGLGHIQLAINDSLDWMWRHNQDESNYHDWMVLYLKAGIIEYDVPPEVSDVVDCAPSWGNGFTPWTAFDVGANESLVATTGWSQFDLVTYTAAQRYISDVQKLVGTIYQVTFHPDTHRVRILPTPKADRVAVCAIYRKATVSAIFQNILFRDLATARTKIIWGEILSRDDFTMPGGGKVRGDLLLQNARQDLDKVEKQIWEESARPFIMTDLSL